MGNRALVMSGGGAKGAFEVGASSYLINEKRLDFEVIAGVSTGSLNAVMLAQAKGFDELKHQQKELEALWLGIQSDDDIYRRRFLGKLLVFLLKDSMFDPKPLRDKLAAGVSPERIRGSGRAMRVGAVDLEFGYFWDIDQNEGKIREWALGSSSMPLMFPPVQVDDRSLVDGGVRNITPLEGAFKALKKLSPSGQPAPPDEMYVVLASPLTVEPERRKWKTGLDIGKRGTSILINQVYREDLDYALQVNESVSAYRRLERVLGDKLGQAEATAVLAAADFPYRPPKYREVRMWTIVPDREFSESLQFERQRIRDAFAAGQEAAKSPLSESQLRELLDKTAPRKP